jgi:hypothetical protein
MTDRNGRSSWERQGIIAFCTCQWNEWMTSVFRMMKPKVLILPTLTTTTGHNSKQLHSTTPPGNPFHNIHFNIIPPTDIGLCGGKRTRGFLVKIPYTNFMFADRAPWYSL